LNADAITKLLDLYPTPDLFKFVGNFANSPEIFEHKNSFDARMDVNQTRKSDILPDSGYGDDPTSSFPASSVASRTVALSSRPTTANAQQSALGYTHTFFNRLLSMRHAPA